MAVAAVAAADGDANAVAEHVACGTVTNGGEDYCHWEVAVAGPMLPVKTMMLSDEYSMMTKKV